MTRRHRDELRHAVDQARRAQLEAQGGYAKIEADHKGHQRTLNRWAAKGLCEQCGQEPARNRFCSNACRKLWHYHHHREDEYRKRCDRRRRARQGLAA